MIATPFAWRLRPHVWLEIGVGGMLKDDAVYYTVASLGVVVSTSCHILLGSSGKT